MNLILITLTVLLLAQIVPAQEVVLHVAVLDNKMRPETGLVRENFRVFEDNVEHRITHFKSGRDIPLSAGILLDNSSSMIRQLGRPDRMNQARMAVLAFLKTANPEDEFFLMNFDNEPRLLCDFTGSFEEIRNKLVYGRFKGGTALFDALSAALGLMGRAKHQKKALLILSDGGRDNASRIEESAVNLLTHQRGVQIWVMAMQEPSGMSGEPSALRFPTAAENTGGRNLKVADLNQLPDLGAQIGIVPRSQYLIAICRRTQPRAASGGRSR